MEKNLIEVVKVCGLVLVLLSWVTAQNHLVKETEKNVEITNIEFGQTIEREMVGGQTHSYKLKLNAGDFVKISVEQRNCDVILVLRNAQQTNIFEYKDDNFRNGLDEQTAAAEVSGDYELRLVSFEKPEQKGSYTLKFLEKRIATDKEINQTGGFRIINGIQANFKSGTTTTVEIQKIIEDYFVAREKFRAAENFRYEAITLSSIGTSYGRLGNWKKALEVQQESLEISRKIERKKEMGLILTNIGATYTQLGEPQKALEVLTEAEKLAIETGENFFEFQALTMIGGVYEKFGDINRAKSYYERALEKAVKIPDGKSLAVAYNNLGKTNFNLGAFETAAEFYQKAVETAKKANNKRFEGAFLANLGQAYFALGDSAKALKMLDEALNIILQLTDKTGEAAIRKKTGQIQLSLGENEKALENLNKALELFNSFEDRQNIAETLLSLAKADFKKGDFEAAQFKTEQAINYAETLRKNLQNTDLRDSFSTNLQGFYSFYIEILMQRHKLAPDKNFAVLAFEANERAKARGLLNLLAESNADIRQGVDVKLLEKETELKNLLSVRIENLTKALSGKPTEEQTVKLKREIEQIRVEYEQIQAQIRTASPNYAALTQPRTLPLAQIQREVLDNETVLLEYALGETKSYLWVVSNKSIQAFELPKREVIETSARQVYDALTARSQTVKFETAEEQTARIEFSDADFRIHSNNLSQMIIAPAGELLANKKLLIVADGALQFVPFASLKYPPNANRYLIETNQIVNLPSASVLAVLRKEFSGKTTPTKTLAVLADPIFTKEDERFATLKNKSNFEIVSLKTQNKRGFQLSRLPFTRREANSISALVAPNQQTKRLDFQANRQFVLSSEIGDYRYLHFATHGFIDAEMPEMSGIVLSLFDETGAEQDGFLRVGDIFNLKLNAELVVLSGCRTGLGKEIRGEGLVGLTRGFMYAGARRVAVSLWDVNDEATSELMTKFYREMLGSKETTSAESLRQAQISMIRSKKWSNPYFWASFIMQGEPK